MKTRTAIGTSATLAIFLAAGAAAGPANSTVSSGSATFSTTGATTTVTTSTDNTIINYNSFNIGAGETVNFILPGMNSAVLNRINGGSPTNIDGTLLSNGRVFIVNPSGVMFGANAVVNVGHLYAAAGNLSNQDFLAGRNNFTNVTGTVANYGQITGDFVGLIGARVANYGTITAPNGTVVMASGNNVYLSERFGQMHVKVERATDAGSTDDSLSLAAGDTYTLAAWHDGTTTAQNIIIASAGEAQISGSFAATDPSAGGLLTITGTDVVIGSGLYSQPGDTLVDETTVENAINSGLDISVDAEGTLILPFDVTINKTQGGEATLTLNASDTITLDGSILNTSDTDLHLDLNAGSLIEFFGDIDLRGGALSAVATHITLGLSDSGAEGQQGLGHRIGHEHDSGVGQDESDYDHQHHKFHEERGELSLQAGVIELNGSESVTGEALLSTNSTIGGLSADGFTALSDALQIEMLGTPANNDFAILITGPMIDMVAPLWQSSNGGGLRMFSTGSATLGSSSMILLDGRFIQEGPAAISLGGDISTTGDDILFAGDMMLTGDLLLRANDGSGADALLGFQGTVDGNYALSGDAGNGRVIALQDIGSKSELDTIRLRGRTIDLYGDATSGYQQVYIADTLTLHGSDLETTLDYTDIGIERASIDVLADSDSGFAGNLVITGDSSMTILGELEGDRIFIEGTTNSSDGGSHALSIDSGYASTIFGGTIGTGVDSGTELGHLEVYAMETELHGSVYTHGMSFFSPVAIHAETSTIHTGDGVAWFGDDVYSAEYEGNSVEFLYSGDPEVMLGANRTPFKFTGYVGAMEYGNGDRSSESEYAFTNIQFGDDRTTGIDAASFLFAKQAQQGNDLTPYFNDWDNAYVYAFDSITMGRGQKITSFGTLEMSTGGESFGTIAVGDINVLGDLFLTADQILFRARPAGAVEGVSTEQQRIDGIDNPTLTSDFAMEIIVSGSMTLEGNIGLDLPEGASLEGGPQAIRLAAKEGLFLTDGNTEGIDFVRLETVDQTLFESLLFDQGEPGRNTDSPPLYAYDLAITGTTGKRIDPNLGLGFNGIDRFEARYAGRYLPGDQVLSELALNPKSQSLVGRRDRALAGSAIIADISSNPNPSVGDYSITLDRLSRGSVDRLEARYVALFGDRADEDTDRRVNSESLHASIAGAWTRYRTSGGEDGMGFAGWAFESEPVFFATLIQIRDLIDAVDGLGLTPIDHRRAHARTLERLRPEGMEFGIIERMLQGIDQLVIPEETGVGSSIATR